MSHGSYLSKSQTVNLQALTSPYKSHMSHRTLVPHDKMSGLLCCKICKYYCDSNSIKSWKVNFSVLHIKEKFIAFGKSG